MGRLTDNDKKFGPVTYAKVDWNPISAVLSSGGDDDSGRPIRNSLTVYAFGYVARVYLPSIISQWKIWVPTGHYSWAKSPDSGYWDIHPREYGFRVNEGFLQIFLGAQTHDSVTTQSWSCFLPWTQWNFVRHSLYNPDGSHFWTEDNKNRDYKISSEQRELVQKTTFFIDDYDGERITATCYIEEREWHFGTGCFKWLKWFRKPMIRRDLSISFDKETGREKGSWKGGTVGHGIEMKNNETSEQAIRRYCDQEHKSKSGKYKMTFVGVAQP